MTTLLIVSLIAAGLLVVWLSILIIMIIQSLQGFSILVDQFIKVNQDYYEAQIKLNKKSKDNLDILTQMITDFGMIKRYISNIEAVNKSLNETGKLIKDDLKDINELSDDLKVNTGLANDLAVVSNNLKLLDRIAANFKSK